jgi:hypothetical protein
MVQSRVLSESSKKDSPVFTQSLKEATNIPEPPTVKVK